MKKFRASKKYTFAMFGIFLAIESVYLFFKLGLPEKNQLWLSISTQLVILIITVTYLTGQAKIDISAIYGSGNKDDEK